MKLSLQAQYNTIALEAQTGGDALKQAISRLPLFFKDVSATLVNAFKYPFVVVFPTKDLAWAAQVIEKKSYGDMRRIQMPCVPGLKVDYPTYIHALHECAVFSSTVDQDFLKPFISYLAKKLANADAFRNRAPDDSLDAISLKPIEALYKLILPMLDGKNDTNQRPYGELFRRHADWANLVKDAGVIHRVFVDSDHRLLEKDTQRADELLGTLIQRLQHSPNLYEMSAQVVETVAEKAYACASAVEFYAMTLRNAAVLDHSLDKLVDRVKAL